MRLRSLDPGVDTGPSAHRQSTAIVTESFATSRGGRSIAIGGPGSRWPVSDIIRRRQPRSPPCSRRWSWARIADPQGAEICPFKSSTGDPAGEYASQRRFFWNTTEPAKALRFYEKVIGFSHRSMDMGAGGAYHIVSRDGVDRGATSHLAPGVPPHWLDDPDATLAKAKKLGAKGGGRVAAKLPAHQQPTLRGSKKSSPRNGLSTVSFSSSGS
jgi:hypothetical protein